MSRRKILFHTNAPWQLTGLGSQGRAMLKYFSKKQDKYEWIQYCSQTMANDPNLNRLPCKAYGSIPADQQIINQLNQDPGRARDVAYGGYFIDEIIKKEKIDIYLGSDDQWSFSGYADKAWWNKINSIQHITLDSRPIIDMAFDAAKKTKNYITWAKFAELEMKKHGPEYSHVKTIYGASDPKDIEPISKEQKLELRKKFGIDKDTIIFLMVNRNQLRKGFALSIQAFTEFKKENPGVKAKLHFHTSFSEKSSGWDIEKLAKFYGVKLEDILCTYVCRACGNWHVTPYKGEDIDCPYCGAQKSNITASIAHGLPQEEMKFLYGMADGSLSIFNSGGLELHSTNSLFAGLYTAITNYSCGEDFAHLPFVHPIAWSPYHEPGTNFIKAASDVKSIKGFMAKTARMSEKEKQEISEKSRDYAVNTFGIEAIGPQWEKVFDAMTPPDWSSITLEAKPKNPAYPNSQIQDNLAWIKDLYKNILNMDNIENDDSGVKNWLQQLQNNMPREQIYQFFIKTALDENNKNRPPIDFGELLDRNNGKKRAIFVIRESVGDCLMVTSLFKSFHEQYPDTDLYIGTENKYTEIFDGNPYVKKVLQYQPFFENEMACVGAGQSDGYFTYYFHAAIQSQRILNYLSASNSALQLV